MIRLVIACMACLLPSAMSAGDEPHRAVPLIHAVTPDTAKAGAAVEATGEFLDATSVATLSLIQGDKTIQVKIDSQTAGTIKFTIPSSVKPGRYELMVLTKGLTPQYIEEPVILMVE